MYEYLTREIHRLADEKWMELGDGSSARAWKNAFRLGAAHTVRNRLVSERQESETRRESKLLQGGDDSKALARVARDDEEVARAYKNLGFGVARGGTISNRDGYSAGRRAGQSIGLGGGARLGSVPGKLTTGGK
jgi:hypothetical protein